MSGTSQAAPHIAGAAALYLQMNPGATVEEVRTWVRSTAISDSFTGAVPNNQWGYGKQRIVCQAGDIIPPTATINFPLNGARITGNSVTINATASDNVGVIGVQFKINGNNYGAEDPNSPYSINWDTTNAANGNYVLTATARDAAGNLGTSLPITVEIRRGGGPADCPPGGNGSIQCPITTV